MTIDESIEVLICHKLHWKRLLSEGICDASEGRETIDAFTMAIASLEAWGKVKAEIDEQYDRIKPYNIFYAEGLEMALEIIDKYRAEGSDKE